MKFTGGPLLYPVTRGVTFDYTKYKKYTDHGFKPWTETFTDI